MQTFGFLSRLRSDRAGNTIAIAAASLIPLIAMVGGAVDASRYYMATTRLQSACDAGALAARRSMADDTFTSDDETVGLNFFDQNYADGTFGLTDRIRDYSADAEGTVTGVASGDLPMTLMSMFGFDGFELDVSCTADINISNTDIMFVLDVTGSMNCPDDGSSCPGGNNGNVEAGNARIRGLRTAVVSFYDAVEDATSDTAQVRYGIVPYASNINVGASIPNAFMATSNRYQSREPQWNIDWIEQSVSLSNIHNRGPDNFIEFRTVAAGYVSRSRCQEAVPEFVTAIPEGYSEGSIDLSSASISSQTMSGTTRTTIGTDAGITLVRGDPGYTYSSGGYCRVGHNFYSVDAEADFDPLVEEEDKTFVTWEYKKLPPTDLTTLYDDNMITLPTGNSGTDQVHTWTGCIEEANTVTDLSFNPIPSGANDLDINLVPNSAAQMWKPQLPLAVYKRENGSGNYLPTLTQTGNQSRPSHDCPKAALRLGEITREFLEEYVREDTGFRARSNTYHDIGMIWGARFITPNGIFAADNATAPNGDAIARHIVFMTDGELSVNSEIYNPYGVEWWDRRISTSTSTSNIAARHAARFQAACRQARQENISVWVVAFGTTLTSNLRDCATPGRAYSASDADSLEDAFEEIAQKIAALRLTS